MISAGEASGDLHAAHLIRSMRDKHPSLFFCGIGGAAMREAGAKIMVDADQLSVVGITEVIARLPAILNGMAAAKKILLSRLPDILILIDFPDFNLRLAAVAKKAGIPVFYYITPQVWAWRRRRVYTIKRLVDRAAVILPFEEDFFRQHGVPVSFVGHPLLDSGYDQLPPPAEQSLQTDRPVVGFLPGSRTREIRKLLPVMLEAALAVSKQQQTVRFLVSRAPSVATDVFNRIAEQFSGRVVFEVVTDRVETILQQATLVVAASGTVALEAALTATPMIVVYRMSALSYWLGRLLIRLQHVSLVNLIAQKTVVPELLQKEATAESIAARVLDLLNDRNRLRQIRAELLEVRGKLGGSGASERAAGIALKMLSIERSVENNALNKRNKTG